MEVVAKALPYRISESFTVVPPERDKPRYVRYPGDPYQSLIGDFLRLRPGGIARLYFPDGEWRLFDNAAIDIQLRALKSEKPETQVRVLTGPAILGDSRGENRLIPLAEEGVIDLQAKSDWGATAGFRVIEVPVGYRALIETRSYPFTPIEDRLLINLDALGAGEAWGRCQHLIQIFDTYFNYSREDPKTPQIPLIIPHNRIQAMIELHLSSSEDPEHFDSLERDEIERLLQTVS